MSALLTQALKTWGALAPPDDLAVTKAIARAVIDSMRAVTEDPSQTEVLPLLATFRTYALNGA